MGASAQRIAEEMVEKMIASLEAGVQVGHWEQPWTTAIQRNVVTGKSYAGTNAINLMLVNEPCPLWGTYLQWKSIGYTVPEGTRASGFVYSPPSRKKETKDGEEVSFYVPSKAYAVFNGAYVKDADGNPYVWPTDPIVPEIPEIEAFFAKHNPVIVHNDPTAAYYHPSKDLINMPAITSFKDNVSYYSVLAHEMIHWTAHKDRVGRDLSQYGRDRKVRAFEELIAEFGAAIIGSNLGLATEVREDHLQYLAGWLTLLKEDSTVLRRAVAKAGEASTYLSKDAE